MSSKMTLQPNYAKERESTLKHLLIQHLFRAVRRKNMSIAGLKHNFVYEKRYCRTLRHIVFTWGNKET